MNGCTVENCASISRYYARGMCRTHYYTVLRPPNGENHSAVRRKKREERKQMLIALLGGKCVSCGSVDNLEFDHLTPRSEAGGFVIGNHLDVEESRLKTEALKCQLLCHTCHWDKTRIERAPSTELIHGTKAGYSRHKCRCDECRRAIREYQKDYWKRMGGEASLLQNSS